MQGKAICPKCRTEIPLDDINVSTNIALCRQCGQTWNYADLVADDQADDFNAMQAPGGAWFRENPPRGFEAGVSTRSPAALFLVPFMCVWSGFSLGGIYGSQIVHRQFNLTTSLFGIPFLLGTLIFGGIALMTVCGKITVKVDEDDGVLFTGVGPIGLKRRFNWRNVTAIHRTQRIGRNGTAIEQITFDGEKKLGFASGVKRARRDFLYAALRNKWRETAH